MIEHQNLMILFHDRVQRYGDETFVIRREGGRWKDLSWNEIASMMKEICLGLIALGLSSGDRVAILSETRLEWMISYLAILSAGGILAPIYHTNSSDQCRYVVNDSGSRFVFAEDQEQVDKLLECWEDMASLEKIIVLERFKPPDDERLLPYSVLRQLGHRRVLEKGDGEYWERLNEVQQEDLCALVYTSGTTGRPKGTMISHGNLSAAAHILNTALPTDEKDRGLAFLPMAHVAEMLLFWTRVVAGQHFAYADDVFTLPRDVIEVEPTFFMSTPRFYEKYYNQISGIIEEAPWYRRVIIDFCFKIGHRVKDVRERKQKIPWLLHGMFWIAYLVTFRKIRKMFGGRIHTFLSAGAPIAPKIVHFFAAAGMPIYEAYGLTETTATGSYNTKGACRFGSVGKPICGIEVKLDGDREILIKSPGNCRGYWNQPQKTSDLFDDGWLRTGDVGHFDEEGFLFITDRQKDIFINSSGKNLTPSYIENMLKTSRFVSQAMVYGDRRPYVTAILTLDEVETVKYARDNNIVYTGFADLTKKKEIFELIEKEIWAINKELSHPEQVRRFVILEEELRQDDEEVTPTMKIKRQIMEERYREKIEEMYR